jgi:hypothetical protein
MAEGNEEGIRRPNVMIHGESEPRSIEDYFDDDKRDDKNLYENNPLRWFMKWIKKGDKR